MAQKLLNGFLILLAIFLISFLVWLFKDVQNLQKRSNSQRELLRLAKIELLGINISQFYPQEMVLGRGTLRQKWLANLDRAADYLINGKTEEAKKELKKIEKSISKTSFFDKSSYKDGELLSNPDTNNDGISDWLEGIHRRIKSFLEKD